jgi:hypothetical protein
VGFAVAMVLLAGFLGYWTNWFGLTSPGTGSTTVSEASGSTGRGLGADLVQFVLPVALILGVVLWIWFGTRDRQPRFDQLPPEEQARRREAGRILREVVPPVSEEEARRMLAPPWERGPDDWPQRVPPRIGPESGS